MQGWWPEMQGRPAFEDQEEHGDSPGTLPPSNFGFVREGFGLLGRSPAPGRGLAQFGFVRAGFGPVDRARASPPQRSFGFVRAGTARRRLPFAGARRVWVRSRRISSGDRCRMTQISGIPQIRATERGPRLGSFARGFLAIRPLAAAPTGGGGLGSFARLLVQGRRERPIRHLGATGADWVRSRDFWCKAGASGRPPVLGPRARFGFVRAAFRRLRSAAGLSMSPGSRSGRRREAAGPPPLKIRRRTTIETGRRPRVGGERTVMRGRRGGGRGRRRSVTIRGT
jgi:hypothetical protein